MFVPKILRENWSDELAEQTLKDFATFQEDILLIIAERLEKISKLSPREAWSMSTATATTEYLNEDMARIKRAIHNQNMKYAPQIAVVMKSVAKENFYFAKKYFNYRKIQIETVKRSSNTSALISSMQKQVVNNLLNLSHTYAYSYNGKVEPIGKTYRRIVNKAVIDVATGGNSFQQSLKKTINQLSASGIKTLEWDKSDGKKVVRRADSHIRMNINEGVRRLNTELQEINGKAFGADGVETSLHVLCAPDHQEYQGKQFSLSEWEEINSGLKREWGTLNCRHFVTYIIMGVSNSVYSDKERKNAITKSNEIVAYNGKNFSRYSASQELRNLERKIRLSRSRQKAFETVGDLQLAKAEKQKIKSNLQEYKNFCSQTGLSPKLNRTYYYI